METIFKYLMIATGIGVFIYVLAKIIKKDNRTTDSTSTTTSAYDKNTKTPTRPNQN